MSSYMVSRLSEVDVVGVAVEQLVLLLVAEDAGVELELVRGLPVAEDGYGRMDEDYAEDDYDLREAVRRDQAENLGAEDEQQRDVHPLAEI